MSNTKQSADPISEKNHVLRVLYVGQPSISRDGIRDFLKRHAEVQWVGASEDWLQTKSLLEWELPDVALVDVRLPRESGWWVARRIRTEYPAVTIVILSDHDNAQYREAAKACDASSFIPKQNLAVDLPEFLDKVRQRRSGAAG